MLETRIGVQLYTLRDHCKDVESFDKSCAWIAEQGVREVQVSGVAIEDPAVIRKVLDAHGLTCTVTHRSLDALRDKQASLDYHAALGCTYTALGHFSGSSDEWRAFADEFSVLADAYAEQGLSLGYHNHSHEFIPFEKDPAKINPKENPMWLLFERCSKNVWFEIDTYWVAHGGADPADWIERVSGRIPVVHFKDLTMNSDHVQTICEVGAGNLNWSRIVESCKRAGVESYMIERDNGEVDAFESLRISIANMRTYALPKATAT
jgi:sugar phosphate isomerase/epimerase